MEVFSVEHVESQKGVSLLCSPILGSHKIRSVTKVSYSLVSCPAHPQFQVLLTRMRGNRSPRASALCILPPTFLHPSSKGCRVESGGQGLQNLCHVLGEEGGVPRAPRLVSSPPREAIPGSRQDLLTCRLRGWEGACWGGTAASTHRLTVIPSLRTQAPPSICGANRWPSTEFSAQQRGVPPQDWPVCMCG